MIRLRNNPMEGSSVRLSLSFRDGFGNFYVPSTVTYTMLALNSDEESWSVVDDIYKKSLSPCSSTMTLVTPVAKLMEGTTLVRKIIVQWTAYVDGTYTDFSDEVSYEVKPMPYVPDHPEPESYVSELLVSDLRLQIGSAAAAPVLPVFLVRFNQPVLLDSGLCWVERPDGVKYHCSIEQDLSGSILTVTCLTELMGKKSYLFVVSGYKSSTSTAELKDDFKFSFITDTANAIQLVKDYTASENGEFEIQPDAGYGSMGRVNLTVAVPEKKLEENKTYEVRGEGTFEVVPTIGYDGMEKVTLDVMIPDQVALYCYRETDTARKFWFTDEVDGEGDYSIMPVNTGSEFVPFATYAVSVDMTGRISFTYGGSEVVVTRYEDGDVLR